MVLIRDGVAVLHIAHVCELVAPLLVGVLQETFSVTDGHQQFCSKKTYTAFVEKQHLAKISKLK